MSNLQKAPVREINTVTRKKNARLRVALIFPNSYYLGMSNLGLQTLYYLLNRREDVVCDRFFRDPRYRRLSSPESRSSLKSYDILAFSVSFELDLPAVLDILRNSEIPMIAASRQAMPLVLLGGIINSFNPRVMSPFCDLIYTGEAEVSLDPLFDLLAAKPNSRSEKRSLLEKAAVLPGVFVPGYNRPEDVKPACLCNLDQSPVFTRVFTPETEFADTFLIEMSRGCPWGCAFCVTTACCGKFRCRSLEGMLSSLEIGLKYTNKIGLVSAAVSDFPYIDSLVERILAAGARFSVSSLRAESVSAVLLKGLVQSGQKTVTFAPEAGTERLRAKLNKSLSDKVLLEKIALAKGHGVERVRLYFMIGLPEEEEVDLRGIVSLGETASRILPSRLNIGIFVPKPKTPLADCVMNDRPQLLRKIKFLQKILPLGPRLKADFASVRQAVQEHRLAHVGDDFYLKSFESEKF